MNRGVGDPRQAARGLGLHAHAQRPPGERGDRADPGRRLLAAERLLAPLVEQQRPGGALEQEQQAARRLGRLEEDVPGRGLERLGRGRPHRQLLVVEVVEEVDGTQVGGA